MEQIKAIRFMDDAGRIALPYELRQVLGWLERTPVEISLSASNQQLVIKRYPYSCICCGGTENLKKFNGHFICQTCQQEIAKL